MHRKAIGCAKVSYINADIYASANLVRLV